jgi:hypothetical protein
MKRRWTFIGSFFAVLLCGGLALAANPATFNRTTPHPTGAGINITATQGGGSVTWNFLATQFPGAANTWGTRVANPSGSYSGATMVRCNGSATIWTNNFVKPQTSMSVGCFGTGNNWAGILWSN